MNLLRSNFDVLAIGASFGGAEALSKLLAGLKPSFPLPIVITQHLPAKAATALAAKLASETGMCVREADDGILPTPGTAWLAPGGSHMTVEGNVYRPRLRVLDGPAENYCKPSIDVMLRSTATVFGGRTLVAILSGHGNDGLAGCRLLKSLGASVIVQDSLSSAASQMPVAIADAGLADVVTPISSMAAILRSRALEQTCLRNRQPNGTGITQSDERSFSTRLLQPSASR